MPLYYKYSDSECKHIPVRWLDQLQKSEWVFTLILTPPTSVCKISVSSTGVTSNCSFVHVHKNKRKGNLSWEVNSIFPFCHLSARQMLRVFINPSALRTLKLLLLLATLAAQAKSWCLSKGSMPLKPLEPQSPRSSGLAPDFFITHSILKPDTGWTISLIKFSEV